MKISYLNFSENSHLAINPNGQVVGTGFSETPIEKLALISSPNTQYCILTTESGTPLHQQLTLGPRAPALLLKKFCCSRDNIQLINLSSRKKLTTKKDSSGESLSFDNVNDPISFSLTPIPNDSDLILHFEPIINWIVNHVDSNGKVSEEQLKNLVSNSGIPSKFEIDLFSIIVPALTNKELNDICLAATKSKELFNRIKVLSGGCSWSNLAIDQLQAYLFPEKYQPKNIYNNLFKRNKLTSPSEVGEEYNFLRSGINNTNPNTIGKLINSYLRRQVEPNKQACVIATARNEGIYLIEWIAHYRALGFEKIFIYSNDNSDHSDILLSELDKHGIIKWFNNVVPPDSNAQGRAYTHALSVMPEILEYEWALLVDTDEFLVLNRDLFSSLGEFLNWQGRNQTEAIAFNWVYIGSSGKRQWAPEPITKRLTCRIGKVNPHIKSMVRPRFAINSQPHFPRTDNRHFLIQRNADTSIHTFSKSKLPLKIANAHSDNPTESHAYIYHYFFRSLEEFLWKFSRNRGDYPKSDDDIHLALESRFIKPFISQFDDNTHDIKDIVQKDFSHLDAEISNLLSIPSLASAQQKIITEFQSRLKKVVVRYEQALSSHWGDDGRSLLNLLQDQDIAQE